MSVSYKPKTENILKLKKFLKNADTNTKTERNTKGFYDPVRIGNK